MSGMQAMNEGAVYAIATNLEGSDKISDLADG